MTPVYQILAAPKRNLETRKYELAPVKFHVTAVSTANENSNRVRD